MIFDPNRGVNAIGGLVFLLVIFIAVAGSIAIGGPATTIDDLTCFDSEEMSVILTNRDVTIPLLEAEISALEREKQACEMDLKYFKRPLRQPAPNFIAGLGTCVASGAALGWAASQ